VLTGENPVINIRHGEARGTDPAGGTAGLAFTHHDAER